MNDNANDDPGFEVPLQLILGTDRRNPCLNIYRCDRAEKLHVYYGLELLESLPDDREHFAYKLLVARLYNAGLKTRELQRIFEVDFKTMQRWGEALAGDDAERLWKVLEGRNAGRKLTWEITGYVKARFAAVYAERPRGYNAALREEIKRVFDVSISGETLRPLLSELLGKGEVEAPGPEAEKLETPCESLAPALPAGAGETAPDDASNKSPQTTETKLVNAPFELVVDGDAAGDKARLLPPADAPGRKGSPIFSLPEGSGRFCHHAGLLLFSQVLTALAQNFAPANVAAGNGSADGAALLKQWLAALLLGAVNIEQSKFLDFDDLELLLGVTVPSLQPQRLRLAELGQTQTGSELLRFNLRESKACAGTDFYYDPHTKHYTGQEPVLKGWCANRRMAAKVLHTDCIHAADGSPLFLQLDDNFHDLRQRFLPNLKRFRVLAGFAPEAVLTVTVDRGIYDLDTFVQIIEDPCLHIITWEKGYRRGTWRDESPDGAFVIERSRNRLADVRSYHFAYLRRPWSRDKRLSQIIVRATNPANRTVEVSILCDDLERPAPQIIRAIFWRWIQENDYKYLGKHYGFNQIVSYAVLEYATLRESVVDKQMKTGEYKALEEEKRRVKSELGRLLVAQRRASSQSATSPSAIKRAERIKKLDARFTELEAALASTAKEASRMATLIEKKNVRLDTRAKFVMDALRLIARNAFYRALAPFKKLYDNFRDDHEHFRHLTLAPGILVNRSDHLEVHLIPSAHYPRKTHTIIQTFFAQLNAADIRTPNDSGRRLRFFLGQKHGIGLAPENRAKDGFS